MKPLLPVALPILMFMTAGCANHPASKADTDAEGAGAAAATAAAAPAAPYTTPYTAPLHALRGPVAEVTTATLDLDSNFVGRESRTYNQRGQMTSEIVEVAPYGPDTMILSYGPDGELLSDDPDHTRMHYDSQRRLTRVENAGSGSADASVADAAGIIIVYSYDRSGRLTHEATAAAHPSLADGEWVASTDYDYDRHGLRRITRHDHRRGGRSVMRIDTTGAPIEESHYDGAGRFAGRRRYHIHRRDPRGNWTNASVSVAPDSVGPDTLQHNLTRTIIYYERP